MKGSATAHNAKVHSSQTAVASSYCTFLWSASTRREGVIWQVNWMMNMTILKSLRITVEVITNNFATPSVVSVCCGKMIQTFYQEGKVAQFWNIRTWDPIVNGNEVCWYLCKYFGRQEHVFKFNTGMWRAMETISWCTCQHYIAGFGILLEHKEEEGLSEVWYFYCGNSSTDLLFHEAHLITKQDDWDEVFSSISTVDLIDHFNQWRQVCAQLCIHRVEFSSCRIEMICSRELWTC